MELTTERLRLRRLSADHFEPFVTMNADVEVRRYIGNGVLTREESWWRLARYIGHWELRGYGMWAVEESGRGAMVGYAGLLDPDGGRGLEVGWALARAAWGRGYGFEAASAALQYARGTLGRDRVRAVIQPANHRSIRLAERLGGQLAGELAVDGKDVVEYIFGPVR